MWYTYYTAQTFHLIIHPTEPEGWIQRCTLDRPRPKRQLQKLGVMIIVANGMIIVANICNILMIIVASTLNVPPSLHCHSINTDQLSHKYKYTISNTNANIKYTIRNTNANTNTVTTFSRSCLSSLLCHTCPSAAIS